MKRFLASIELAAIVNELQFLVHGKITQIYDHGEKELLLQLHAVGQGKHYLRIIPGKLLNLTEKRESPLRPTGFCMQLRKYLSNASIKSIQQKDSERIIVFELEKEKKYFLIIELFSKGNIILTDEEYQIIGSLDRQIWKDRSVKSGEKYVFPEPKTNWKEIDEKELSEIIKKSERKNLATSLAIEIGLGGLYAEELCKRVGLDKDKLPSEANEEDIQKIIAGIKAILSLIEESKGYIYEKEITPFPLLDKEVVDATSKYNEAINTLNPLEKISPYQKKIEALGKMISQQEKSIRQQKEKIELNKKKGETIYENYAALQKLKDVVKELRKEKDWQDIEKELKKEKKIKSVNLKEKKIIVDLTSST